MKVVVGGKNAGSLVGDVFIKKGPQAVLFRNFDGFGMAESLFKDWHFNSIEVHYDKAILRVSKEVFLEKGIPYHKYPFEPQLILPRKFWEVKEDQNNPQMSLL